MRKLFVVLLALVLGVGITNVQALVNEDETDNDTPTGTTVLTLSLVDTYQGDASSSDLDYWQIAAGAGAQDVNFQYSIGGVNNGNMQIFSDPAGYAETNLVATINDNSSQLVSFNASLFYIVKINATNGVSRTYTIDFDKALPVELSTFTAVYKDGQAQINWTTLSERNNLGFNVLRSTSQDGKYQKVNTALVKGHGTDATVHEYGVVDDQVAEGQAYWYVIEDVDFSGNINRSKPIKLVFGEPLVQQPVPTRFALWQNYPNPFNPETWFAYDLGADATVTFRIYNARGQMVRQLNLGQQAAGAYRDKSVAAYWDGRDAHGEEVSSGVYFYQLQAGDFSAARRMVILR